LAAALLVAQNRCDRVTTLAMLTLNVASISEKSATP
jgi:hypothetical protein